MFTRKYAAVATAVCSLLVSAGFAKADAKSNLTLDPQVVSLDDAAPQGLTMQGLRQIGVGQTLDNLGINIYGFIEGGYTYNLRHHGGEGNTVPGPFAGNKGNHIQLDQLDLAVERLVDAKKFDVGGKLEVLYGTDGAFIHSNGLAWGQTDLYQVDLTQAYIDINLPVMGGLKVRGGKFVTLASVETINPTTNAFYSHSYIFNAVNFAETGLIGFLTINDQLSVAGGISRGWDQCLQDNNGAIDGIGQVTYNVNKDIAITTNFSFGPEDNDDTSHYRTMINPTLNWKVNSALTLGADTLFVYDGARNESITGTVPAYGDNYGVALYAGYVVNDYLTANVRGEWFYDYTGQYTSALANQSLTFLNNTSFPNSNLYELTLGVTITPMPKDNIGKNLSLRPEVRYDCSEDRLYEVGNQGRAFRDQWTVAMDVIFKF